MSEIRRFACSPGGAIQAGRQRLGALFLALSLAMLGAAAWSWWSGRLLTGVLCVGVAVVVWTAWSLTADLDDLGIEVDRSRGRLRVLTRSQAIDVPLSETSARVLSEEEQEHLGRLASLGIVTLATGGFESHRLGEFQLYATNLTHAVLVETADDRLVLTPDDPQRFLEALG